jgi:hypothetical protein
MASKTGFRNSIGRGEAHAVPYLQDLVGGDRLVVDVAEEAAGPLQWPLHSRLVFGTVGQRNGVCARTSGVA